MFLNGVHLVINAMSKNILLAEPTGNPANAAIRVALCAYELKVFTGKQAVMGHAIRNGPCIAVAKLDLECENPTKRDTGLWGSYCAWNR